MTDPDNCDIDTLTAFLEESDDDTPVVKNEAKDECDMDEITAFLEESEDEDMQDKNDETNQESKKTVSVEVSNTQPAEKDSPSKNRHTVEDNDFSDLDDVDFDEIDNLEISRNSATIETELSEGTDRCTTSGVNVPENSTEVNDNSPTNTEDNSTQVNDNSPTNTEDTGIDDSEAMEGSDPDDVNEEMSEEEDMSSHDAIKAEMMAMAERMKQLQDLLEKNTPKSKSKSGSPKTEHKPIKNKEKPSKSSSQSNKNTCDSKLQGSSCSKLKTCDVSNSQKVKEHCSNEKIPNRSATEQSQLRRNHSGKIPSRLDSPRVSQSELDRSRPSLSGSKGSRTSELNNSKTLQAGLNNSSRVSQSDHNSSRTSQTRLHDSQPSSRLDNSLTDKNGKPKLSVSSAASKTFMTGPKSPLPSTSPRLLKENTAGVQVSKDEVNPFFGEPEESEVKVDSKTLFGDSDDSDWEDLAGDEKTKLSGEGKEMKKLLTQGTKKREAHVPSYDPTILKKPAVSTWAGVSSKPATKPSFYPNKEVEKVPLNPDTGTVSGKYKVRDEYMPKVAIPTVEDSREFVQDPYCGIRIVNPRISMDSFKTKMDGRSLVKISRLLSKFGTNDLQKDNWVTLGVVVHKTEPRQSANGKTYCIWKLSDLVNCDQTVSFFLFGNVYKDHWKNKEGAVIGLLNPSIMDKAEKAQSEVALTINHPQQLLIMGVSKDLGRCRGTTKAGAACGNFINKNHGEYCTYHVQTAYRKTSSKRTELQASTGRAPQAFDQKKRAGPNSTAGCFFYAGQTFTSMKPRTTNTKDKVTLKKLNILEAGKEQGKLTTMSLHDMKPQDRQKLDKIKEKDKQLLELLAVPTVGSMNFVKHLVKKDKIEKQTESDKPATAVELSAKDLLKQHKTTLQQKQMAQKNNQLPSLPKLGKGFQTGQEISLDVPVKTTSTTTSAELAKKLAIAKVKLKGGLDKEDPNAVRKKITSPENRDKIKKRVAEDMEAATNDAEEVKEPPKKRSKLLGNLDLNSDEVQKLLKVKSKHKGALAEAESEHEERYFSTLEKKEKMEEKMDSIKEVPFTVFMCKQCNYRYYSLHDRCKQENHSIKRISGVKRFFKCKQCKRRCTSLDKMPTKPCKECGSSSFERVSMLKEKSGPKLESEELSLRGNEQKYVGAIQGKSYLNV